MTDKELIDYMVRIEIEKHDMIKEYQKSTRLAMVCAIISIAMCSVVFCITTSIQVNNIAHEASESVRYYFETDYDYATINQEQTVDLGGIK